MDETAAQLEATAHWAAAVRARETGRPDGLFTDPWADALAGPIGRAWAQDRPDDRLLPMTLRTRFFDDYLRRVTEQDGIRQVVLLAAGLDTRAFRLDWPADTVLYELDRAGLLAYKDQVLGQTQARPTCQRQVCPADLTDPGWPQALLSAGFVAQAPSVWLAEGLFFYLPTDAVETLLTRLGDLAAPGSGLGFDTVDRQTLTSPLTREWVQLQADAGAPWLGAIDDPAALLSGHGWDARVGQFGAPDTGYGRWPFPPLPADRTDLPHHWLVTATRTQHPAAS